MLHSKNNNQFDVKDEIFGSVYTNKTLSKFKMPEKEMLADSAYYQIMNELILDGNATQNLATFVQTWAEPQVQKLMQDCIVKNMIDKDDSKSIEKSIEEIRNIRSSLN